MTTLTKGQKRAIRKNAWQIHQELTMHRGTSSEYAKVPHDGGYFVVFREDFEGLDLKSFIPTNWESITEDSKIALIEWWGLGLTHSPNDNVLKEDLAGLVLNGEFHFWNCPICNSLIHVGPESWLGLGVHQDRPNGDICHSCTDN